MIKDLKISLSTITNYLVHYRFTKWVCICLKIMWFYCKRSLVKKISCNSIATTNKVMETLELVIYFYSLKIESPTYEKNWDPITGY